MKDVMITVHGYQSQPDGSDQDCIELVTEGKYQFSPEKTIISYAESELTGFDGCTTEFSVYPDYVTMMRIGSGSGEMIFNDEKRNQYHYSIPGGSVDLGVFTLRSSRQLDENGGKLEVHYILDLDNRAFSKNSFVIEVRNQIPN